jgi:hypothetical protein
MVPSEASPKNRVAPAKPALEHAAPTGAIGSHALGAHVRLWASGRMVCDLLGLHYSRTAMARPGGWRRVRSPRGRAQWAPLVPSAARRAAFGRVGDGAGPAGTAPCDRPRPPHATTVRE